MFYFYFAVKSTRRCKCVVCFCFCCDAKLHLRPARRSIPRSFSPLSIDSVLLEVDNRSTHPIFFRNAKQAFSNDANPIYSDIRSNFRAVNNCRRYK